MSPQGGGQASPALVWPETVPTQSPAVLLVPAPLLLHFGRSMGADPHPSWQKGCQPVPLKGCRALPGLLLDNLEHLSSSQQKLIMCPYRRKQAALDFHTPLVSVEPGLGSPSAPSPPGSEWEAGRGRRTLQCLPLPQLPGLGAPQGTGLGSTTLQRWNPSLSAVGVLILHRICCQRDPLASMAVPFPWWSTGFADAGTGL